MTNASINPQDYPDLVYVPTGPQTVPFQYTPFTSVDGTWPPAATYDPSLMAAFGFAPNMMQQQFYFPGTQDMNIWGQDPISNPLMMNYPLLSPVNVEQQQMAGSEVTLDTNTAAPAPTVVDPTGLAQGFSGMMLNGTVQGVMAMSPTTMIPNVAGAPVVETIVTAPTHVPVVAVQSSAPQPEKPKSWAAIASQPAKPRPPPPRPQPQPEPQIVESSSGPRKSQGRGGGGAQTRTPASSTTGNVMTSGGKGVNTRKSQQNQLQSQSSSGTRTGTKGQQSELVGKLLSENKYNPGDFTMSLSNARFFVIKSYAEDDIHRSIKYSIWTSTEHGNRRLDQAYRDQKGKGNIYLLFSVNGSGHFCGVAQMMSEVDTSTSTGVWAQDKWKGRFDVKWVYVKDVPNSQLRHIRLENNENKPVTNSRDTQEVPLAKAKQVMKIIHSYQHTTSIFDDFDHYEKKQEEESGKPVSSITPCLL